MAKRVFLMLAHTYNKNKKKSPHIGNWYWSVKLDGARIFWDGGITRGLLATEVPWANVEKDVRLTVKPISTGLWSRYGKVIRAPDWWLDKLPPFPLDGEAWIKPKSFQTLISTIKDHTPGPGWQDVKYMVFDSPSYLRVFADGEINEPMFKKRFLGINKWINANQPGARSLTPSCFKIIYNHLQFLNIQNNVVHILEQHELPSPMAKADATIEEALEKVLSEDGEGIIIRNPGLVWTPERTHSMLKYKPFNDAEGTVTGYTWGRETELGSKLLGKMGALIVDYKGQRLKLSGFTDAEREMLPKHSDELTRNEPYDQQGEETSYHWENRNFPRGKVITFSYRELSDGGIPKEGRYCRNYESL